MTTNRIPEVAGVSIGSAYQYFPDKGAIFTALHERHMNQIDRIIQRTLVEHATASLEKLMRALIEARVTYPELSELLLTEVPHKADGSRELRCAFTAHFFLRSLREGES